MATRILIIDDEPGSVGYYQKFWKMRVLLPTRPGPPKKARAWPVSWQGADRRAGVYFLRLSAGADEVSARKVLMLSQ